jgi:hypothetical protein
MLVFILNLLSFRPVLAESPKAARLVAGASYFYVHRLEKENERYF